MFEAFKRTDGNGRGLPAGEVPTLPKRENHETAMANFYSKKLRVKIYEMVGENLVIAGSKSVPYTTESILFRGERYVLNKEPEKIIYEKDPWLGIFLVPTLMMKLHECAPMDTHEHQGKRLTAIEPKGAKVNIDARKIARVANKNAWNNVYPSVQAMLETIALVAVLAAFASIAFNIYLFSDPNAVEELRGMATGNTAGGQTETPPNTVTRDPPATSYQAPRNVTQRG